MSDNDTDPKSGHTKHDLKASFIWNSVQFTMDQAKKEPCNMERCPVVLLYSSQMEDYVLEAQNFTDNYVTIKVDNEQYGESAPKFLEPEKVSFKHTNR